MSSHVLLVDHDRDDRLVFARALRTDGFHVDEAHNGLQALQKALDNPTDVVVTDVAIPGIDGFELCRRLRQTASTSRIPIITSTVASTFLDDTGRAEDAGSDALLVKPYEPEKLIAEIHRVLARARELSLAATIAQQEAEALLRQSRSLYARTTVTRDHWRRLRERTSALRRLRSDFLQLPGLRMTPQGGARFWHLDVHTCARLLDSLVEEKFLVRTRDGRYKRA